MNQKVQLMTIFPHTPTQLCADIARLGVAAGQVVMLHTSVKAVGPVLGGPNTILQSLLDVLTTDGTLMMYVGWQEIPDWLDEMTPEEAAHYRAHHPPFDPATSRAVRENSILAEFLRTWPGAHRSLNAENSMSAVGAKAAWITADHPLNYGYGPGSPLENLVQVGGKVLLLGSPLDTVTLLHYAENRARMRHKNRVHYQYPVLREGQVIWIEVDDFETGEPHGDYSFEQIVTEYLATGQGQRGMVGSATSYLLDAADLTTFAIAWLEARYG
jgi:aminoglycoside 3-N-acetyltransferase